MHRPGLAPPCSSVAGVCVSSQSPLISAWRGAETSLSLRTFSHWHLLQNHYLALHNVNTSHLPPTSPVLTSACSPPSSMTLMHLKGSSALPATTLGSCSAPPEHLLNLDPGWACHYPPPPSFPPSLADRAQGLQPGSHPRCPSPLLDSLFLWAQARGTQTQHLSPAQEVLRACLLD